MAVEKFRTKEVINPEKAMTAKDLGLPERFEEAMKRHLGELGSFAQIDGKYYLDEKELGELKKNEHIR